MKVKVVFWVRHNHFNLPTFVEEVYDETIIDMGEELGILVWHKHEGFRRFYRNWSDYMKCFQYTIQDAEVDMQIVELGEF